MIDVCFALRSVPSSAAGTPAGLKAGGLFIA